MKLLELYGYRPQEARNRLTELGASSRDYTTADVYNVPVRRGGVLPVTEYIDRTELDLSSGLTGAIADAVTAPARAARGEISEDQMVPEAFNFAGSLTLGSLLAPRPTGSVGMGGRAAKEALDMTEAARMARASQQGWHDPTYYHGTASDVDAFSKLHGGRSTGAQSAKHATWLVDNPNVAAGYADLASQKPVSDLIKKSERAERQGKFDDAHKYMAEAERIEQEGGVGQNIMPLRVRGKIKDVDMDGAKYDPEDVDLTSIINQAKEEGYDGVRLTNFSDDATYGTYTPATHIGIFDPSNIRSVNAAFDPAKSSSANLLAANAKTGAAVPLATKALEAQQPQGIRAFHGSPHDFERFDMSKIGTGEGAQAYGHGLYFAEAEDVAKTYRSPNPPSRMINSLVAKAQQDGLSFDDFLKTVNPAFRNEFQLAWDAALGRGGPGHMYEVNIKADPQDFLDWDKPRDGLAPKVQEWIKANHPDVWDKAADGSSLYQHLQNKLPDASQSLREAGIPGIRYLDQMSRGAGEGSYNYVIFDDAIIDIVKKYGLAGAVALGALSQSDAEAYAAQFGE